ncbi:hypothetical protein BDV93DRAFT_538470 [Ceratobasidium sp. AG-I]|nr:hypothetical protein BDV93DRAFT_538470 [Ceratobasidium sp. AG-I]
MWSSSLIFVTLLTTGATAALAPNKPVVLLPDAPLLHKHGRWDAAHGTWWAGSGFKLVASGLTTLSLHLGNHTMAPLVPIAMSVDYAEYVTINATAGVNNIPIPAAPASAKGKNRVVRINVEQFSNTRIELKQIELNAGAVVKPYKPSPLRFQFIGDSLSAGYFNPRGVNDAWDFLTAQEFKAEQNIIAQPGACLTEKLCYGNVHGMAYQYYKTEDTGYYYTSDHNYTTPWDFRKDLAPTHIVLIIGANDNSNDVTLETFTNNLSAFADRLRAQYPKQPIFVFSPWGWANSDGVSPFYIYYPSAYSSVVNQKNAAGDKNIFLVDTTGWVGYDGVIPNDGHPNVVGHQQVFTKFTAYLKKWGLQPRSHWES